MNEAAIRAVGAEIAKVLAPLFADSRRALLRGLGEIATKPTGLTAREVVHFMQERGYKVPQCYEPSLESRSQ
jgi:hypothetical protein